MTMPRPSSKVMDMSATSVSAEGELSPEPIARTRRRRWPWVVLALVVLVLIGVLTIPTPYYLFEPGSVTSTQANISITGHRSFTTRGTVLFTTVEIQRATLALL